MIGCESVPRAVASGRLRINPLATARGIDSSGQDGDDAFDPSLELQKVRPSASAEGGTQDAKQLEGLEAPEPRPVPPGQGANQILKDVIVVDDALVTDLAARRPPARRVQVQT